MALASSSCSSSASHVANAALSKPSSVEDLVAALRLADTLNWTEGVRTHFTLQVGDKVYVQPHDFHWSVIRKQDLISFELKDDNPPCGIGPSAFHVHRALHKELGQRAACILHAHTPFASLLSCLSPGRLEMVHQNCAYFYGTIAYVDSYTGTESASAAAASEMSKVVQSFTQNPAIRIVLLANHGVTVIAQTVHEAFDDLFYFENACRIYISALKTGTKLRIIPTDVCQRVADMRDRDRHEYGLRHFKTLIQKGKISHM